MKRFEVKKEIYADGKTTLDPNKKVRKLSPEEQAELDEELNAVGFGDFHEPDFGEEPITETANNSDNIIEENNTNPLEQLTDKEIKSILHSYESMSIQGEVSADSYIGRMSKQLGVDKEEFRLFVREQLKAKIKSPEKVLHYHRTSLDTFKKVLESGYLLNRANIRLQGGDISNLRGSSSNNIQFSADRYNEDGELQSTGFDMTRDLGAASTDVVFVMGPELLNEETYDCAGAYPTVEKANIRKCCATILAKNPEVMAQLESLLQGTNIIIPVVLQEKFDRESVVDKVLKRNSFRLAKVNGKDISNSTEETGLRLVKVNGKSILRSGVEATTSIRSGVMNEQIDRMGEIQRGKTIKREDNALDIPE